MKKILSLIIAAAMILSLVPLQGIIMTASATDHYDGYIKIITYDSYSDGWNGATLVVIHSSGIEQTVVGLESGSSGSHIIGCADKETITFQWNEGKWDSECRYEVWYCNSAGKVYGDMLFKSTVFETSMVVEFVASECNSFIDISELPEKYAIYFGSYPQNRLETVEGLDPSEYTEINGKNYRIAPVRWEEVSKNDDYIYLLSDSVVDAGVITYSEDSVGIEAYDILLGGMLNADEAAAVIPVNLTDSDVTGVKLYTLSDDELSSYSSREDSLVVSDYALAQFDASPLFKTSHWIMRTYKNSIIDSGISGIDKLGANETIWISNLGSFPLNIVSYFRPSMRLDRTKVLFASERLAKDGENGAWYNVGTVAAMMRLTLLDENRQFSADNATVYAKPGAAVDIDYTGALTGEGEYISAMIVDAEGEVIKYSKLVSPVDAAGTLNITLPKLTAAAYTLRLFNERVGETTDVSSAFSEIELIIGENWDDNGICDVSWYDPEITEFVLSDGSDLGGLAAIVNGTAVDEDGVPIPADSFAGKTVILDNDVSLLALGWTMIGSSEGAFAGVFDAAGHIVSGCNASSGSSFEYPIIESYTLSTAAQQGVVTDGKNIYTGSWNNVDAVTFRKYTMGFELLDEFNIDGVGFVRDLTYDGEYFYATNSSNTIYCIDFENKQLIDTIVTDYNSLRHISYDPTHNCLWTGEWDTLCKISCDDYSAESVTGGLPSIYGSMYDSVTPGGPYLWLWGQDNDCTLHMYNIEQNSIIEDYYYGTSSIIPGFVPDLGITAGGSYMSNGIAYLNVQFDPNEVLVIDISNEDAGFFGMTQGAEIRNFVVDCDMSGSTVAGIVVSAVETSIINCGSKGVLSGSKAAAGIVGEADDCRVINCYSAAAISGIAVGGIACKSENTTFERLYFYADGGTEHAVADDITVPGVVFGAEAMGSGEGSLEGMLNDWDGADNDTYMMWSARDEEWPVTSNIPKFSVLAYVGRQYTDYRPLLDISQLTYEGNPVEIVSSSFPVPDGFELTGDNTVVGTTASAGKFLYAFDFAYTDEIGQYHSLKGYMVYVFSEPVIMEYGMAVKAKAVYGMKLIDISLPRGCEWEDPMQDVGEVGDNFFTARYVPRTGDTHPIVFGMLIKVRVVKADPIYAKPKNLTGVAGEKLSTVALPEGFEWAEPDAALLPGEAVYDATYSNGDDYNYNTAAFTMRVICG